MEVESKNKILEIPQEKQPEIKEITVVVPEPVTTSVVVQKKIIKKSKQKAELKKVVSPFLVGETFKIDLYYLGLRAATLSAKVMPFVSVGGKKAFHLKGIAETTSVMALIYKLYNEVDTYMDYETFTPVKTTITMNESKQNAAMIINYDQKNKVSSFWKKRIDKDGNLTEINRVDELMPMAQDIFSSLYYVRTLPLKVGEKFKFPLHDNGKNWSLTMDVVKAEKVWTRLGEVETLLLHPVVERDDEKFTKATMLVWVTNDAKKVPVKFEAEVKLGSMKGIIKDYIKE
jgi:Protein of unknown function (DUF3108)